MSLRGVVEIRDRIVREIPSPRYSAGWDRRDNVEEAEFEDLDEAIAWSLARSPLVYVNTRERPWEHVRYRIGGRDDGLPPWPHALPDAAPRVPRYGEARVYVTDLASWEETGYEAVHREGDAELERCHHGWDLEAAIDWGRERAPVVVADLLPDAYSAPPPPKTTRYSAGIQDPAGERLPRLRPREGQATMRWRGVAQDGFSCVVEAPTRREAHEKAIGRYIQERLKPAEGTHFVLGGPSVEPLEDP